MWALVKNGEVAKKATAPEINTSNKRHMVQYRWVEITETTGSCEVGDAFLNGKFLGPITASGSTYSDFNFYTYVQRTTPKSTTSTSEQEFITLVCSDLEEGDYRLNWTYSWNVDSTKEDFKCAMWQHIDNSVWDDIWTHQQEAKESGGSLGITASDQQLSISSFRTLHLVGDHSFGLWFNATKKKVITSMWNAQIELTRVR